MRHLSYSVTSIDSETEAQTTIDTGSKMDQCQIPNKTLPTSKRRQPCQQPA